MSLAEEMERQLEISSKICEVLPGVGASNRQLPPTPPTTPPTTTPVTKRTPIVWDETLKQTISPPLRELSNRIYNIIDQCLTGPGPSLNPRIRVMHVTAAEAQTGGRLQNYAPNVDREDNAARRIAFEFQYRAAGYTADKSQDRPSILNAEFSDLSWAFWKPFLAYTMMLRHDKKYLMDRIVQILHCLSSYQPPAQLGKDFFTNLHGLESAWVTFEFYSPLFSGEDISITRLGGQRYQDVKEIWPIRIRNQRLVAWWWKDEKLPSDSVPSFPINHNTQSDTRSNMPISTTPPQMYPRSPRVEQPTLSHANWRNLNDFLARLYAVKCKTAGSDSGILDPSRRAGWWLWNGLFALVEGVETEQLDMDRNDNAKAVAYIWMSYHALRLRQADFAPAIKDYGDQFHEPTKDWYIIYGHREGRSPAAIGNLFNIEKIHWSKLMSERWDLWWDILHELQARMPGDFEQTRRCLSCWGHIEGATTRSKLVNALYNKFKGLRADLHAQELLREEQPELDSMLAGEEPDPIGRWDWKKDITETYEKERAEAAGNNNTTTITSHRSLVQIREHFRGRLFRIHAEQEELYPIYEENALRRECMHFANGQWAPTKTPEVKAAIDKIAWHRAHGPYVLPRVEVECTTKRLRIAKKDGEEIVDLVERYLTKKCEDKFEALRSLPMDPPFRDGSDGNHLRRVRGGRSYRLRGG